MTTFTPLANYAGYHHILGAGACFVHPGNGNIYYWACEQKVGTHQDLSIYREVAASGAYEHVVTFSGTVDAEAFIERGGCVIGQGGALVVATTMIPIGVPHVTETGYQGVRCRIPNVDAPWNMAAATADPALVARVGALERLAASQQATISAIETALTDLQVGGDALSVTDRAALTWLANLRALLRT